MQPYTSSASIMKSLTYGGTLFGCLILVTAFEKLCVYVLIVVVDGCILYPMYIEAVVSKTPHQFTTIQRGTFNLLLFILCIPYIY